jgi:hypothetical protein
VESIYTVYLTRFQTYIITLPHQTKTLEGRRPQTDKHLPHRSLYRSTYKEKPTFRIGVYKLFSPCSYSPILYDRDGRSPTWARAATPLGVEVLEKPTFRIGVY